MGFDKETRKLLAKTVTACRWRLTEDVTDQLRGVFGLHPDGTVLPLDKMTHLSPDQNSAARRLRDLLNHYTVGAAGKESDRGKSAYERMVLEISFTILNRLAALRLCEERGLIIECVRKGTASAGFQMFDRVSGGVLGGRYDTYRVFLECLFDEIALDLGMLFDRMTPQSVVFPTERCMEDVLTELNKMDLMHLWTEDETIGWIYQYFNPPEERKAMRDASQAPRNSRELAVRNQFFTPRYVVEFLTDNTLGRIWYEMRKGDTALKDMCRYLIRRSNEVFLQEGKRVSPAEGNEADLSREELLKKPLYIEHRTKKDPRDLRVLDPADGSGHFLLYAFDLLELIYEDAWADPESPKSEITGRTLREDFDTLDALRRIVPKLIVEHNLHGIDIDPRAVQIAALALWLRAQKTWKNLGIKAGERPRIARSNIVSAEPMPGEEDMRHEFTAGLMPRVLGQLVDVVFGKMKLAGEAGSLLRIEEEIRDAVAGARKQWLEGPKPEQQILFRGMADPWPKQQELRFDLKGITDERFWEQAEDRILDALEDYAERSENGHAARRRLFAEDTARGFAFVDLCRKRFDVVLMNPPFGNPPERVAELLPHDAANNIYPAFVLRGAEMSDCFVGAITDRTFVVQQSFGKFRARLTSPTLSLVALAELGWGVLDGADVQVAAYIIRKGDKRTHLFASLTASDAEAPEELRRIIAEARWTMLSKEVIRKLPNNAFAHTLPAAYLTHLDAKHALRDLAVLPRGLGSNDANRTYKAWFEVPENRIGVGKHYSSLCNGGPCSPFFRDDAGVAQWLREDGALLVEEGYSEIVKAYDQKNREHYFNAGLSFPKQSSVFNVAALPQDAIPTREGKGVVLHKSDDQLPILAYLNSAYARFFVEATNGLHKQSGPVGMTPVPDFSDRAKGELAQVALSAWRSIASTYRFDEASRLFVRAARSTEFGKVGRLNSEEIFDRIDDIVFGEIEVSQSDRATIVALPRPGFALFSPTVVDEISYALGCAYGRWDIRYATGEKISPELPDPFTPLPHCPPGMLLNAQDLPARQEDVPAEYPVRIPWDGILVDDPGFDGDQSHRDDIVRRVREVFDLLWKDKAHEIEQEACSILGVSDLCNYFRRPTGFFQDHLKRYSKSRRKAPIYFPLSTTSGSYTLWLYYHRLTDQTLYAAVNKYVEPKIAEMERGITRIEDDLKAASGRDATLLTDRLNEARAFFGELRDLREELLRIAALPFKPDLNDGVIINASPFHNLFRLRPWAKDTEDCWKKLENGDYDWANLAYAMWPDRVREVCKTDRSIAIAHGLEELCEVEAPVGKKTGKRRNRS